MARGGHGHFNSIKVQLKLTAVLNGLLGFANFNSIKVQLKRVDWKSLQPLYKISIP